MDVSFNLAIYNDRFGHSRPKILKQATEGGWTLDGSRNSKHFTFLGEIDMHTAVLSASSMEDESSALSYCCNRMTLLCCCCTWRSAANTSHSPHGTSTIGFDASTASPLQSAEEAYSARSDSRSRSSSDISNKINKKGRINVSGFNTHWIGDYSSDESPSPSSKASNLMDGPGSRGSGNGTILL